MAENGTVEGELGQCNIFFVTYYWTEAAIGPHLYTNIALIVMSLSSAFFGIIANILVVLSYFKNARLRTLSNIPLISLAFSDLLVTAVVLPLHVTRLFMEICGSHDCILWTLKRLASYFSTGLSLFSVTVLSVERFITLAYPYSYKTILTKMRMNIAVAAIWLFTFVLVFSSTGLIPYIAVRAMATAAVVLCTTTLLVIWIWVFKLLKHHQRKISANHVPSVTSKLESSPYRNTKTTCVIVTVLLLSYLPLVLSLAYYWTQPKSFMGIYLVTPWGETIVLAHSLFNPLYVFWRKNEFWQTARSFFRRGALRITVMEKSNVDKIDLSLKPRN
jgi:hypothetical protein